jgi:putative ribosome biogenesis GTPase RsgA
VGTSKVTDFQGIQWTLADCYSALYGASLARGIRAATSAEVSEIFSHIGNKSHLAIHGSPGLGKSSLLRAVEREGVVKERPGGVKIP